MDLRRIISPELVFPRLEATDRRELLTDLAGRLVGLGLVKKAPVLLQRLLEREALGTTALGSGVAIPHCKIAGLSRVLVAVATVPDGVDFEAEDGEPVRLVFLVVSPANAPADHLRSLAAISRWLRDAADIDGVLDLDEPADIVRRLGLGGAADDPPPGGAR